MKLTENFTLSEMTKSETALRHGLDNTPGDDEIANLKALAENVVHPNPKTTGRGCNPYEITTVAVSKSTPASVIPM